MDILQMIGQYAFPVVACIAMGYYVKDLNDKNRQQYDKVIESHKSEIKEITTALNNNTLVIQRLVDIMDNKEEK